MKFLPQFAVKNTLIINVAFVFILLMGVVVLRSMQREAFPNINMDVVNITTLYPGSTPAEVEKLITIPIEKELKQVDDIKETVSVSAEGVSNVTVTIEEDAPNKDRIVNEIQRAVDRVDDFPLDLEEKPVVKDVKTKDRPIIEVSLSGEIPEEQLREYALFLEKKILELPDIARVQRSGLRDKEIWVEVVPETLNDQHLSIHELGEALGAQNKTIPGGKFYQDNKEYILRTMGEFVDHEDVKKTIVRASPLGNWLRVEDVAEVKSTFEEEDIINKTLGTRSINLIVIKKSTGDIINLVKDTKKIVEGFKKTADPKLNVSFINDLSFFVERRQNVLVNNGLLGMGFVIIVLFLFLSKRTALAACVGIPTALCLTFILMKFFGITINLISMFGLIMVLGMLVDEDIVISENIYRYLEMNSPVEDATINGVDEVIRPLIVTVLTTIAAFIPLLMMGGIMGKFVGNIPAVVTITLCASLLEAIIILPSHITDLNKFSVKKKLKKSGLALMSLINGYKGCLRFLLKFRYPATVAIFLLLAASLYFAKTKMLFVLFPAKGIEIFQVVIEGLKGDSLTMTSDRIVPIERLVATLPKNELDSFTTTVGMIKEDEHDPLTITKRANHYAQITVYLTPETARTRTSEEIIADLRNQAQRFKGFTSLDFQKRRTGPPVGKPIEVRVRGDDLAVLQEISQKFQAVLATLAGVTDINDDYDVDSEEVRIMIDPIKAAQTDLSVVEIAQAIRHAFDGLIATRIKTSEEEINIVVKFPQRLRYSPDVFESYLIKNKKGNMIKMSHFARFEKSKGALAIKHFDGVRNINVTANVDEKVTSALEISSKLKTLINETEEQYPGTVIHFGGEVEETTESLQRLFHAFYFAAGLILIILIAMFGSLLQPLVIMLSIPFSVIGVIFGFYLHGEPFSFMAILGVVGLTGVVVDSGTLMIDFINKLRERGMGLIDSIVEGSATRLRAIILTSLTTVVGVIPASNGLGGTDPFIQPMAMALNYGIMFGAVTTILYVPVFLAIIEDIRAVGQRISRAYKSRFADGD